MLSLLSYFLKDGKYKLAMSVSRPDEVSFLPTKERPMTPKFFPVSIFLGEPAEGSFAVCRSNDTRYEYHNGAWVRDYGTGPYSKIYDGTHFVLPSPDEVIVVGGKRFVVINKKEMSETGCATLMLAEDAGNDCDVDGFDCGKDGQNVQLKCQEFYDGLPQEVKDASLDMNAPIVKNATHFGTTEQILEKRKTIGGDVFTCADDDVDYSILVPGVEYAMGAVKCRAPSFVDFAEAVCGADVFGFSDDGASQYSFTREDVLSLLYKENGDKNGTRRYYFSDFCSQDEQLTTDADGEDETTSEYVWHNSLLMLSGVESDDVMGMFTPSDAIDGTGENMGYVRPVIRVDLKKLGLFPSEYMEIAVDAKDKVVLLTNDTSVDKDIVIKSTTRDVYEVLSDVNKKVEATVAGKSLPSFVRLVDETDDVNTLFDGSNDGIRKLGGDLINITVPGGVTSIGHSTFENCSGLINIVVPNNVTSIGFSAFYGCKGLTSMTIPFVGAGKDEANKTHFGYIFGAWDSYANSDCVPSSLKTVVITGGTSIGEWAFDGCTGLTSITIPNSVMSISKYAFYGCAELTSITIPDSVTSIGNNAFENCTGLTNIALPDSVTRIENCMFFGCKELKTVDFSENSKCSTIGRQAFSGCRSLMNVTIPSGVTIIERDVFFLAGAGTADGFTVTILASNPPVIQSNTFADAKIKKIIVPAGTSNSYKASEKWSAFANYIEESVS